MGPLARTQGGLAGAAGPRPVVSMGALGPPARAQCGLAGAADLRPVSSLGSLGPLARALSVFFRCLVVLGTR